MAIYQDDPGELVPEGHSQPGTMVITPSTTSCCIAANQCYSQLTQFVAAAGDVLTSCNIKKQKRDTHSDRGQCRQTRGCHHSLTEWLLDNL